MVGEVVSLKIPCLGNEIGTVGVCYEDYEIGECSGNSFIFENGNYDGFSQGEQKKFLEHIGFCGDVSGYRFKNVMWLSKDFQNGYFDTVFM